MKIQPLPLAILLVISSGAGFMLALVRQPNVVESHTINRTGSCQIPGVNEAIAEFALIFQTNATVGDIASIKDMNDVERVLRSHKSLGSSQVEVFDIWLEKVRSTGSEDEEIMARLTEYEQTVRTIEHSFAVED